MGYLADQSCKNEQPVSQVQDGPLFLSLTVQENIPQELKDAPYFYIPLLDHHGMETLIRHLISSITHDLQAPKQVKRQCKLLKYLNYDCVSD